MATSSTDFDHPYYKELGDMNDKKRYQFFTEDNAKRMKFVSLGEGLDFISHGGGNFVFYPYTTKVLTNFIKQWIDGQLPRIDRRRIDSGKGWYTYEEISRQNFYLWNKFHMNDNPQELPRIDYDNCPVDKNHKELILDRGGKLRCAHKEISNISPNFTRMIVEKGYGTGMKRYSFYENEPDEPLFYNSDDDEDYTDENSEEYKEYLVKKEKFDREKTVPVADVCYAIVKEPKNIYLPLETVLERLDSSRDSKYTIHPFSGFTLANYAQAWWEQAGDKKYWSKNNNIDIFKAFPKFIPISTED